MRTGLWFDTAHGTTRCGWMRGKGEICPTPLQAYASSSLASQVWRLFLIGEWGCARKISRVPPRLVEVTAEWDMQHLAQDNHAPHTHTTTTLYHCPPPPTYSVWADRQTMHSGTFRNIPQHEFELFDRLVHLAVHPGLCLFEAAADPISDRRHGNTELNYYWSFYCSHWTDRPTG